MSAFSQFLRIWFVFFSRFQGGKFLFWGSVEVGLHELSRTSRFSCEYFNIECMLHAGSKEIIYFTHSHLNISNIRMSM